MAVEDEIRQASERFYAALNRMLKGEPGPMEEVWSQGSDATVMHPFGGRELGWDEVRATWSRPPERSPMGKWRWTTRWWFP